MVFQFITKRFIGNKGKGSRKLEEDISQTLPSEVDHIYLLDRLGGVKALRVVIEEFYVGVLSDPKLQPFFEGVNSRLLKAHQEKFFIMALTEIPEQYNIEDKIRKSHQRLFQKGLNEGHFDLMVEHLVAALMRKQKGLPEETLAQEVVQAISPLRSSFRTKGEMDESVKRSKSLKERPDKMDKNTPKNRRSTKSLKERPDKMDKSTPKNRRSKSVEFEGAGDGTGEGGEAPAFDWKAYQKDTSQKDIS